jgi:cyanophycin synthetase
VLEAAAASEAQCHVWQAHVRAMLDSLGWPPATFSAMLHANGASLAFSAPMDRLFTATEVNEWAWLLASGGINLAPLSPAFPSLSDQSSAVQTLQRMAAAEAQPAWVNLIAQAEARNLPVFVDEDVLSVGAGEGSRSWAVGDVPADPDWTGLHDVPTALVTGSNGKTTTVRLLAAMLTASGRCSGFNCTDGVFIAGQAVLRGDYSGPGGARTVLRDSRVQAAVLESARGGMLRRGLAVRRADVGIVTNISADHFGEYGVNSLEDLADVKLVLARAISSKGLLVLNADDETLRAKAPALACPLGWFGIDWNSPAMTAARMAGRPTCGYQSGRMLLRVGEAEFDLGSAAQMPLSLGGAAIYNLANLAGAALTAAALGVAPAQIASVLASFGQSRSDNPGRLERWQVGSATVLVDYAHNPEGLAGLLAVAEGMRELPQGRLGLLLGQAGNREDLAIAALAAVAAAARPSRVLLKDIDGYLRGRAQGEVAAILTRELCRNGVPSEAITTELSELEAAQRLVDWAGPGDVVVLPVHNLEARARLVRWLDARSGEEPGA